MAGTERANDDDLDAACVTTLRPYQTEVVAELRRTVEGGKRRVVLTAPTGSGKTVIAAEVIKAEVANGKRVLVLAHRREILAQTSLKLSSFGVDHGIIQAGLVADFGQHVQVASIQTLWTRAMRLERMPLPATNVLIIDECHRAPAHTYRKIIEQYPNAVLLGLTATPCRGDGRGLGGIFEAIVETPQVAALIEQGYLVGTRVYAPVNPDLKGVHVRQGDYIESELAERVDRADLLGDIVTHWHRHGERRKTVCFAVNVAHSVHIRDEFIKAGVRAEHIDGSTPKADRDAALARLASGEFELISNCMVLTEGWDMPPVSCCILARPTKKMGLYRQMIGRVLRPAEGKANALVLDHSGAVFRHGFVEDDVLWTLDPEGRAVSPKHAARLANGNHSRLLECSQCGSVRVAGEACAHCGFLPKRRGGAVVFRDGDLKLFDRRGVATTAPPDRDTWHAMLIHVGQSRGYSPKWPRVQYQQKFGAWPPWGASPSPMPPSPEVLAWVRSRMIAWAKRKRREEDAA
jgi:DNA repair protein RadD